MASELEKKAEETLKARADPKEKKAPEEEPTETLIKTKDALKEQKEANDALEAEWQRSEELRAKKMLGGKADAGEVPETQDEKDQKEADERVKGFV